ncbi:6311_t:CDS:1, partial [Scutellospora calospora]
ISSCICELSLRSSLIVICDTICEVLTKGLMVSINEYSISPLRVESKEIELW